MLLAIDIGNTNTVFGLFEKNRLVSTERYETRDKNLNSNLQKILKKATCVVTASVVPSLDEEFLKILNDHHPLIVTWQTRMPIKISVEAPEKVGIDRLVNAVMAHHKYKKDMIVIDLGTATTFDCVTGNGKFLGGAIAPGFKTSAKNLFERAEKLAKIPIVRPKEIIGKNTVAAVQSGLYFGHLSLLQGMIAKVKKSFSANALVVATGGLAQLFAHEENCFDVHEENLTLEGLHLIASKL